MNKKTLEEWYSKSYIGRLDVFSTQNRYLDFSAAKLFEYIRRHNEVLQDIIPNEDTGENTVAKAIKSSYGTMNNCIEEDDMDGVDREIKVLYALLVLPFAQWLIDTDYFPKKKFFIERMKDYE